MPRGGNLNGFISGKRLSLFFFVFFSFICLLPLGRHYRRFNPISIAQNGYLLSKVAILGKDTAINGIGQGQVECRANCSWRL